MDADIRQLVAIVDQAYDSKSWHGTNLRGSIRGLSAAAAAWRPTPGRHNVWEIVVHAAYWKYAVTRRFSAAPRGSFPLKGSNWFTKPDGRASESAWRADVALLESIHKALRRELVQLVSRDLRTTPARSRVSNFDLIAGIAAHDLYHAGQIQLLKKLRTT
jgi:uncharacterized damage-inducible protein DinB